RPVSGRALPGPRQRLGAGRSRLRPDGGLRAGTQALGDAGPPQVGREARRLAQRSGAEECARTDRRRGRRSRAPRHRRTLGGPTRRQAAGRLEGWRPDMVSRPSPAWPEWIREAEDPARASEKPEALDDLLVLDCSVAHYGGHVLAGFLGELGAEVVKLEPP